MMESKIADDSSNRGSLRLWIVSGVVFCVGVLLTNAVFIYLGVDTFNGVTTTNHYEKGLSFNSVLQQRKAQDAMGVVAVLPDPGLTSGVEGTVQLLLKDRMGKALSGFQVQGTLYRNAHAGSDQNFVMKEKEPGCYESRLTPPLPGRWELRLELKGSMGLLFYDQPLEVALKPHGVRQNGF